MGFWSTIMNIFGGSASERKVSPPPPTRIPDWLGGHDDFELDIVGESNYQAALELICGGRTEDGEEREIDAQLILEDANAYDHNAVQVQIQGRTVGYLSRDNAKAFRARLREDRVSGSTFPCRAIIRGGWDKGDGDRGHYGVKLDVALYD